MKKNFLCSLMGVSVFFTIAVVASYPGAARVIDDFDDNTKTGWEDFTFVPGLFLPSEQNGQFNFDLTGAPQTLFSAAWKTTESLELRDGRTLELRVDLVGTSGEDAFGIVGFIPTKVNGVDNNPKSLTGYSLAKDPTDVLITKSIGKYFVDDDTAPVKNDNITLVLRLAARNGSVTITGRILDKDDNNAVIWEQTYVDTPAADVLSDGTDDPPGPFITTGYFTLMCYAQDPVSGTAYSATFDKAQVTILDERTLDDFNDNTKTGWEDFTFVPGLFLPSEQNGQFKFDLTGVPQTLFSASWKTSESLELKEGEGLELRVDLVGTGGEDAFGILGFIPTKVNGVDNNPKSLTGYALAKDPTDVLITKSIGKYFVDDDTAPVKNDNITLVLSLAAQDGSVTITGRILDKDNDNAVIWEQTYVDTPGPDVLSDGTDDPPGPFITTGYFTLMCYAQDPVSGTAYSATFDNAVVASPPPPANLPPTLGDIQPAQYANFLPASTQISFKVTDDKDLLDDKISVTLNGTRYTTANGLTLSGSGTTRTARLGGLSANVNYIAELAAEDAEGALTSRKLYFDTFAENNITIEIEDYNFEDYSTQTSGSFIDNPVPIWEGGWDPRSYSDQAGTPEVDFHDERATPNGADTMYRTADPVRMQHSYDIVRAKYVAVGGADNYVFDYDVGDIEADEWLNYTRTFPAGNYEVYLRQSLVNMPTGESRLERVTGDRTKENQTTTPLGSFLGAQTGYQYRNFPLTDGTGLNKVILNLSGVTTLRLHQVTADPGDGAGRFQNYLIFIPAEGPGIQRAAVTSVRPAPGATVATAAPTIQVEIMNRDTSVKTDTIVLEFNGATVPAVVTPNANGASVTYSISPLPASGASNTAKISFHDSDDEAISSEWNFVISYNSLNAANRRSGPGIDPGFKVRVVQADPSGGALDNSLTRAEEQLVPNSSIPAVVDTNVVEQLVNFVQPGTASAGFFTDPDYPEVVVPGIDGSYGTDDFAVEIKAWLELSAGIHRFGVVTDDGFKISSGASLNAKDPVLGYHSGGPANLTFDFVVPQAGFYPFRMVWYERGGNAYAEWFSVDLATGARTLINDAQSASAIKAYQDVEAGPALQLISAAAVTGPYDIDATATIDGGTRTITVPLPAANRFYQVTLAEPIVGVAIQIQSIEIQGANLVIKYEEVPPIP